MFRNGKRAAALGLAVLLGAMMPMTTMRAAETGAQTEEGLAAGNDAVCDGENALDGGDAIGEESAPAEENVSGEESLPTDENVSDEESLPTDGNVSDEEGAPADEELSDGEDADGIFGASVMSVPTGEPDMETKGAAEPESATKPEIIIARGGVNKACPLGGTVEFVDYMNYQDTLFTVSLGQNDGSFSLFYALDTVTDRKAAAKDIGQMDSLKWGEIKDPPGSIEPNSGNDGSYVVYAKAVKKVEGEADQIFYARSSGIVVDTVAPVIKGVEEGMTYPAGTKFQVEDANLDVVKINEQAVKPDADGNYQVAVNGNSTSCVIRAVDKAKHETVCNITVTGGESPNPENPEPPEHDNVVISESKEYALQAGVKYHLAAGKWKVNGDGTIYSGDNDFYVPADGTYRFTK